MHYFIPLSSSSETEAGLVSRDKPGLRQLDEVADW